MKLPDCTWSQPPAHLALPRDEIHVWCASLDQPPARVTDLEQTLSLDERSRAQRYRFARDRQHFITRRGLLRQMLGDYLGIEPGSLRFRSGPYGKPELAEMPGAYTPHFNVSHSHDLALFAFARDSEVGVDIEYVRPVAEAEQIAGRYFSAQEKDTLRDLPPERMYEQFFIYWTRLETYLKASGLGLAGAESQGLLPPDDASRAALLQEHEAQSLYEPIYSMQPAPGYVAALAVQARAAAALPSSSMRVVYWEWIPAGERNTHQPEEV
jgi:4'-phosphopantetheinyl transferase